MTEERSKTRSESVSDPAVSRIYRDVARERTPASLNESILRQAVRVSGRGYSHALVWLRPMAWAATIGLCLAIVLELTELPQDVPELRDVAARDPEIRAGAESVAPAETPVPRIDHAADSGSDIRPAESAERRDSRATAPLAESQDRKSADALRPPANGNERRQRTMAGDAAPERRRAASTASAFRVTDAPALEEAAATARLRGGLDEAAIDTSASAFAAKDLLATGCDAEAQATPEAWLTCIGELRSSGREDEADEQQRQLVAAFPDFVIP